MPRFVFLLAAVYGMPLLTYWMFITPAMVGHARQQQPEIYYAFGSVGLAWQMVFILIAINPIRYRPLMLVAAILEKGFFAAMLVWLYLRHIAGFHWIPFAALEGFFALAFLTAFFVTPTGQ